MTAVAAYPGSYYAASANAAPERPALVGEVVADVCVVGAGFTGLSAALELAERGHKVVVVEAAKVGWGASGRNGGQIVNGLNAGLGTIERRYGKGTADFVATVVQEGGRIIRERVARYGIACDLKDGQLFTAFTPGQMKELEAKQALWRSHGLDNFEMLDRAAVRGHVATEVYAGGMTDRTGGHFHPLNLALGQAAAVESLGGVIYEATPVVRVEGMDGTPVVRTAGGVVRAGAVVLAGNAYLGEVVPEIADRVMPFSTQIMATEPLGERGRAVFADGRVRRGRALCARLLSPERGRATAVGWGDGLWRDRSGGYPGEADAEPRARVSAAEGRAHRLCVVGELRDLVQPGAADGADRGERLLCARVQRAWGGREPPFRTDTRRGGARRPRKV